MVLELDHNPKSGHQNGQGGQRTVSSSKKDDPFFAPESQALVVLISPRVPYGSMGASLFFHALVFLALVFVQFPRKKSSWIDFEHEKITYYRISQSFPDISSSLIKTQPLELRLGASDRPDQLPESRSEAEITIRPIEKGPVPLLVELPRLSALPRLELPNILMTRPKTEAGEEPISVSQEVVRDIGQEMKQKIDLISPGLRAGPGVSDPLPMQQSPYLEQRDLKPNPIVPNSTPQLNLPLPLEPLDAGASLLIALDEPKGKGEVGQLPSRTSANISIYSSNPVLPKAELRTPKANLPVTLNASPQGGSGKGAGSGTPEFGNASIAIPGVAIKNRVPLLNTGIGVTVLQAPKPSRPAEKKEDKPAIPRLNDLLPPLHRPLKLSSYEEGTKKLPSESPLEEVEKQGKQVYTTAINVLNLTSKRGSWVFRFTDLSDTSKPVPQGNGDDPNNGSLTRLSAVVKVDPRYPPDVIRDKVEGVVVLYAIIRQDGKVDPESVRLIRKLDSRLDLSAKEALLQWRFKPGQKGGRPVDIQAEISVPFYFRKDPVQP